MNTVSDSLWLALRLIADADVALLHIVGLSLRVSAIRSERDCSGQTWTRSTHI